MRVLIVGGRPETSSLAAGLEAAGVETERRADDPPPPSGPQEIEEIAGDLRELESELRVRGVDAVLAGSDSPAALAAVVVATKLRVPVASLLGGDQAACGGANARVIRQVADVTLAPDAEAIMEWARDGYPARA